MPGQKRELIRYKLVFYGRVQGVGFRYTAYYSALNFGLTGWVRNEYDGSVHAEVQGIRDQIESWKESLGKARYIIIEGIDQKEIAVVESERSFSIKD